MTRSREYPNDGIALAIATSTGLGVDIVEDFFSRFEVDMAFQAYSNVITTLSVGMLRRELHRLFSGVAKYKEVKMLVAQLSRFPALPKAEGTKSNGNPVPNYPERPIAAFLMTPRKRGYKFEQQLAYDAISSLVILALLSGDALKGKKISTHIRETANRLRIDYEQGNTIGAFRALEDRLPALSGYQDLCSFVRSNAEKYVALKWLSELIGLIDAGTASKTDVHSSSKVTNTNYFLHLEEDGGANSSIYILPQAPRVQEADDVLFTVRSTRKLLPDLKDIQLTGEMSEKGDNAALELEAAAIVESRNNLSRFIVSRSFLWLDRDILLYDRSLFNTVERRWMRDSISESSSLSSLVMILSMLTAKTAHELAPLTIGPEGDFTADGCYKRRVPLPINGVRPDVKDLDLYPLTSDVDGQTLLLPLPAFVSELISNQTDTKKTVTIESICAVLLQKPNDLVVSHVRSLREKYGQRFIPQRISGQLRNFVSAKYNDPCLTYALFGKSTSTVPTAYYYRSLLSDDLASIYQSVVSEYFLCE